MGGAWRVERDSNPRKACTFAGFQDRSNRPLCHLPVASRLALGRETVQRLIHAGRREMGSGPQSCRAGALQARAGAL